MGTVLVSYQRLFLGYPKVSNTQVSTGRSCTSSVLPAAGAEDGHVKNAGKTEFRSRRLGLCFLSGVNCGDGACASSGTRRKGKLVEGAKNHNLYGAHGTEGDRRCYCI